MQRAPTLPADASFVVVADRLADPGNPGTILRSAEAAGADAVVLTPGSVDPFNPKVVRATAGALFRIPVVDATLADSRARRFRRARHVVASRRRLHRRRVPRPRRAWWSATRRTALADDAAIDQWITIPHAGPAESLNVAMAATVLAFEVARQRSTV